jgi:hypothetical protein
VLCKLIYAALVLAGLAAIDPAFPAEFRVIPLCPSGCNAWIYVVGKIEAGDGDRFREVVRRIGPAIDALVLRSPGGSMYDSIKIGTIAYDLMLDTYAPYRSGECASDDNRWGVYNAPCTCLSGCFLIWMGGVNRYGVIVGMHRPWDQSGSLGRLQYNEASSMYKRWIDDLKTYLAKMELPDVYFAKFIETVRSGQMKMLSGDDLLSLNNNPSKIEWLSNRCGEFPTNKAMVLGQLSQSKFRGQPYNATLWQQLASEYNIIRVCKTNALQETRTAAFNALF